MPAGGPLDVGRALMLGLDIARGLEELHAVGIIVADLKPDNVLLEEGGRALLTDFGISKACSDMQCGVAFTSPTGTPHFMWVWCHSLTALHAMVARATSIGGFTTAVAT